MTEAVLDRGGRDDRWSSIGRGIVGSLAYPAGFVVATSLWLLMVVGPFPEGAAARWEWREGIVLALQLGSIGGLFTLVGSFLLRGRLAGVALSRFTLAFFLAGGLNFGLLGVLNKGLDFWTLWSFAGPIVLGVPFVCVLVALWLLGARSASRARNEHFAASP